MGFVRNDLPETIAPSPHTPLPREEECLNGDSRRQQNTGMMSVSVCVWEK